MTNTGLTLDLQQGRRERSFWVTLKRLPARQPLGAISAAILLVIVVAILIGPSLTPYEPNKLGATVVLDAPSLSHPFGTDHFGRDQLARVFEGGRVSFRIGILSMAASMGLALALGIVSGYVRGTADAVMQRAVDVLMAFPPLILAMAVVAMLGYSPRNVIIAIVIIFAPQASRVIRSATLGVVGESYIEAARAIGCSDVRIMARHVLPQVIAPWLILATSALGAAILTEATLSFLGLGVPPPNASLGNMLSGPTLSHSQDAPWLVIVPGAVLSATIFAVNLLGDALRDILDPSLR